MAYPHDLRAPADLRASKQPGCCDRCGFKYYLDDMPFQVDQRGNSVQNIGLRCCPRCYDDVATILAPVIIIGPEGVGSPNPRPYHYQQEMSSTGPELPFSPNNPDLPVVETAEGGTIVSPGGYKQTYVKGYLGI
jgi:hypothetical protein